MPDDGHSRPLAWRMTFTVLVATAMAMATAAVTIFGVLAPFLVRDLAISRSQLGLLVTVVSAVGAVSSLVAGRLADRLGGRALATIIFGIGILVFVGTATARSFGLMMLLGAVCGFGNGAANPATNKLVAEHYPPDGRGLVMGIKQSGVQAGLFVAGLVLPPAALAIGWRRALLIGTLVPIVALLLLRVLVPSDKPVSHTRHHSRTGYRPSVLVRWMMLYGVLMGAGGGAIIGFLPLYAEEGLGLSVTASGLAASLFGITGVAARIMWARQNGKDGRFVKSLGGIAWLSVVAVVFLLGAAAWSTWAVWAGAVIAGLSVAAWTSVGMLAVVDREPAHVMGRASGLVSFAFLAGMSLGPTAFGWAVDHTGSYVAGWWGVLVMFALSGLTVVGWRRADLRTRAQVAAGASGR